MTSAEQILQQCQWINIANDKVPALTSCEVSSQVFNNNVTSINVKVISKCVSIHWHVFLGYFPCYLCIFPTIVMYNKEITWDIPGTGIIRWNVILSHMHHKKGLRGDQSLKKSENKNMEGISTFWRNLMIFVLHWRWRCQGIHRLVWNGPECNKGSWNQAVINVPPHLCTSSTSLTYFSQQR